jgi:hypothetical protein
MTTGGWFEKLAKVFLINSGTQHLRRVPLRSTRPTKKCGMSRFLSLPKRARVNLKKVPLIFNQQLAIFFGAKSKGHYKNRVLNKIVGWVK